MLAFACEPDEGSEPEVGWKWAHVMAESCDVTVVTQAKNRKRIESWNETHPDQFHGVRFSYLELGPGWRWLKKKFPGGMYFYYAAWQWKLRKHVASLLINRQVDLIHHVTFASFRMPVFACGKPFIWGPVGGAELAPMHLLAGHGTVLGRTRERMRNLSTLLAGRLVRIWEPTGRNGGLALASTPATASLLRRNRVETIVMPTIGYDPNVEHQSAHSPTHEGPLRLLFVGRLHLLKGVYLLLRAMTYIDPGTAVLTVVGDGPERTRLRYQVEKLGLLNRVSLTGFLQRSTLRGQFACHDVVIAPSLYESGGLSVLEGFAHGLPAIVLDCGGHSLLVDGKCGIKILTNQSQEEVIRDLAAAIQLFADNRELCKECGTNAFQRVEQVYSWPVKHTAMRSLYDQVIAGNPLQIPDCKS